MQRGQRHTRRAPRGVMSRRHRLLLGRGEHRRRQTTAANLISGVDARTSDLPAEEADPDMLDLCTLAQQLLACKIGMFMTNLDSTSTMPATPAAAPEMPSTITVTKEGLKPANRPARGAAPITLT